MAKEMLTDIRIKKITPPTKGQADLWDTKLPGFGIRVSSHGTKSFILIYRFKGKSRRFTIGRYPIVSLAAARKDALNALTQIHNGIDPSEEKIKQRQEALIIKFDDFVEEFIEKYAKRKNKDWKESQRIINREFTTKWKRKDITTIEKKDINLILDAIIDRGSPSTANHALAAIRRLFNWAVERGVLDHSPCYGIKPPAKNRSRDRVLSDDELTRVWRATLIEAYPFGVITQLLILTGQRLGEVRSIQWSQIGFDNKIWSIPAEQNKSGRAHEVPLTNTAIGVLRNIPYFHKTLLFPAQKLNADRPVSGFGRPKQRLDQLSEVSDWRMHDLRRTVATGMARNQIPPHVVERILNHKSGTFGGVAGVYNRFGYLPEMREALEIWETHILCLISDREKSSIPPITRKNF